MAERTATHGRAGGQPTFAVILTWILPGAGHVYIGRPLLGLAAFLVVDGFFLVGLWLTEGRTFEFLQPDLQGPFAGALTPEVGNLGGLVYQMRRYGFGPGFPRPWPEHVHLGAWLTATSGLLNVVLMARVHLEAQLPGRAMRRAGSPDMLVLAAWLVPGLGHALQGRRKRGIVVAVVVVGLLALGTVLAEASNLDRERHFYYWAGQFLAGGPAMLLEVLFGGTRVTGEIPYVDAGLGMGCMAGLLNVLAWLDVYGWEEERVLAAPVPEAAG